MQCILGKKVGMTTLYTEDKGAQNVTLIECPENVISCVRTIEKDGYMAIGLSTPKTKKRTATREFRVAELPQDMTKGSVINVDIFSVGDRVSVQGVTKGKGFQGVVKRHGFKGAPQTHGHKHDLRKPGSIGATTPEHVFRGKRMAGRMGRENFTVENLQIVYINKEERIIGVRGAVPGIPGGMLKISPVK